MAAMAVDKEEPPYAILAEVVGKAEQRDGGETRLRGHDLELEILNLILFTARTVGELKHKEWNQNPNHQKGSPRQSKAYITSLIKTQ